MIAHFFILITGLFMTGYTQTESSVPESFHWNYVDFEESMQLAKYPMAVTRTQQIAGIDGTALLALFKSLFDRYNLSFIKPSRMVIIPKIIHQIWLGGEVPEEFKALMQGWIDRYVPRGWEYRLWTDADIESFGLYNKAFYDQTTNYGVKSDILKWEIIHRLGGVYIDVDFEPLQLLDVLHHTYDFYVGIQPLDTQFLQLGAALFAATPGHPILRHCIETIKDDWHHHGAPTKTGPVHFTKSFFKMAGKDGRRDIAFPASYMYPLGCQEKTLDYETWIHNGAYAIHHWAKSWMPKNYRPAKFRTINNDDSSKSWND